MKLVELIIVGAEWCNSCKVLKKQLEASEIIFEYKDMNSCTELLKEYNTKSLPFALLNQQPILKPTLANIKQELEKIKDETN